MATFLVTGGAGFIGSHIVEELLRRRMGKIIVFDNFSSGSEKNLLHINGEVKLIQGDIRDINALALAMHDVDTVFHEAAFVSALKSYEEKELTRETNEVGTRNVLEIAKLAGVKRVILASSAAVYGPMAELPNGEDNKPQPESPYASSKLQNEIDAIEFAAKNMETVCLRYFNVYGPRQDPSSEYSGVISRFVDATEKNDELTIFGDGKQTRDFVNVRDVARANVLAAISDRCGKGEAINIGTGVEITLLQIIDALRKSSGKEIQPRFQKTREGDIPRSAANITRARQLLNFDPEVSFEDGIAQLLSGT